MQMWKSVVANFWVWVHKVATDEGPKPRHLVEQEGCYENPCESGGGRILDPKKFRFRRQKEWKRVLFEFNKVRLNLFSVMY